MLLPTTTLSLTTFPTTVGMTTKTNQIDLEPSIEDELRKSGITGDEEALCGYWIQSYKIAYARKLKLKFLENFKIENKNLNLEKILENFKMENKNRNLEKFLENLKISKNIKLKIYTKIEKIEI